MRTTENRSIQAVPLSPTLAGYKVFEALAVSEVLFLCENQQIDVIVIGPDVEDPDVVEVQMRHTTIRLKPEATSKDLIWELSQIFRDRTASTIQ